MGAHIFEIAASGLPLVANQPVVVYLGSNDVGYPEASIAKFVADFVAAAQRHNVKILAWVGSSVPMTGRSAAYTDDFFVKMLGGIP